MTLKNAKENKNFCLHTVKTKYVKSDQTKSFYTCFGLPLECLTSASGPEKFMQLKVAYLSILHSNYRII